MRKARMALARTFRCRDAQAGIALLAVLWSVALLVLVALVFSSSVQIATRTAIYRKEAAQAHAIACGGVEAAVLEIGYPPTGEQEKSPLWTWRTGQREGTVPFRGGKAELQIVNETGKVDLNAAPRDQLIRAFEVRGLESTSASELAAAVIHWRGPAGSDQKSVALEDYYQQAGYPPRHALFASLEEVLRLRGMTREVFYGTVDVTDQGKIRPKYGVGQDLTVFSSAAQVNVNYASAEVLQCVPGVSPELAGTIVQERRREPFRSMSDVSQRLPESLPDASLPLLTTSNSKTYSIVSVGEVEGSQVRRTVKAVVQVASQGAARHRTVAWYDDYVSD